MNHSPAVILEQYLRNEGVVDEGSWGSFIAFMPDGDRDPDNATCVYDTAGIIDGRIMNTGEFVEHNGIAIRIRSLDYRIGYDKAKEIQDHLASVKRETVTLESENYRIEAVSLASPIIPLGESENRNRRSFSLNVTMTVSKL